MVDWPGLLTWSTKYHDGTAPSQFKQMTPEDREFLEKALAEAFGKIEDPNQIMQEAINQIKAEDRTNAIVMTALEVIDKCCDDPDCARNVEKFDGVRSVLQLVDAEDQQISARSLEILALLFANNPNIQEAGDRHGALPTLQKVLRSTPVGSESKSKAFRAIVALVRGVPALEEKLLNSHGVDDTVACLSCAEDTRTREKAIAFVNSLACNARVSNEDSGRLALAIAPLLSNVEPGVSMQYRELLAACANSLIQVCQSATSSKEAVAQLREAASVRLAALSRDDPDLEMERESLEECLRHA